AGAANSRRRGASDTAPAADIEVKLIPHDQTASAPRLHIAPIPVAEILGNRNEWFMIRAMPVEAVPTEANAQVLGDAATSMRPCSFFFLTPNDVVAFYFTYFGERGTR
ncbi:MAG TPA: hypothetical protein VGX70_05000, partial [Gemmataceae bacterium]|nr:hypothetical protein [Gemmataceae bacterium]